MNLRRTRLGLLILAITLVSGIANAQVAPAPTSKPAPPVQALNSDAREVRSELFGIFQQYPPSVRKVLQTDPSLMTNANYLALYPSLAVFLTQHPEIAHNPQYFVGSPNEDEYRDTPGDRIARAVEPLAIGTVFVALIATLGWIIRAIINHRRWLRVSKLQTDTQNKLLERFSSNEEMLAFIQTPAGMRFMESASLPTEIGPRSVSAPLGRMLWSVQIGIVMVVAGGGMEIVGDRLTEPNVVTSFQVAAGLAIALGVGFILSALGSYILSRRLGLIDPVSKTTS